MCVSVCVCLNSGVIKIYLNDLTGYILFLLSIHCVFDECITNFTRFLNIEFFYMFFKNVHICTKYIIHISHFPS